MVKKIFLLFISSMLVYFLKLICLLLQEKKLVIIVTSYNNADWYDKNLGTMFSQKNYDGTPYENYRIIYVDDCSLDGTARIS